MDSFILADESGDQHLLNLHSPEEDTPIMPEEQTAPTPPPVAPPPYYRCDDCGRHHLEDDLLEVRDVFERVAPGEPMPAGECPYCRALCHASPAAIVRYAVFSYDPFEEQQCCDYVGAPDEWAAAKIVESAREDAHVAAVLTGKQLVALADGLADANTDLYQTGEALRRVLGLDEEES